MKGDEAGEPQVTWLEQCSPGDPLGALPVAGLTLVELLGGLHRDGLTAVLPLVAAVCSSGQPLFYVQSGGVGGVHVDDLLRSVCAREDLLYVHDDEDNIIDLPSGGRMSGNISSVRVIAPKLALHDAAHGTSYVLFDQAQYMRPREDGDEGDEGYLVASLQADLQRAQDLIAFVQNRDAATVAVWEWSFGYGRPGLLAQLLISSMHVVVGQPHNGTVRFEVSRREALTDPWPEATAFDVPCYRGGHE